MSQGKSQLGLDLHGPVVRIPSQVVETLDDDKHVVYANAETEERQGGVHGGVGEPEDRGEAHGDHEAHKDTDDASN